MSSHDDEDDVEQPLSNRKALERGDHGKKDRQEALRQTQGDKKRDRLQLRKDMLKQNVRQVPAPSREQRDDQKPTFGPKTFEQQAVQKYEAGAEHTPTPDELMKKHEEEKRVQKQAQYEQQQNVG